MGILKPPPQGDDALLVVIYSLLTSWNCQSHHPTGGQPASLPCCQATIWERGTNFTFFSMETVFRQLLIPIIRLPLWREDGSVIYNCCSPSWEIRDHNNSHNCDTPTTSIASIYPIEKQGSPNIPPSVVSGTACRTVWSGVRPQSGTRDQFLFLILGNYLKISAA
jgi:hypothetical protein